MARGIEKKRMRALKRVNGTMAAEARRIGGLYSCLAYEGFNGGYAAALEDVGLALRGCRPCRSPDFWDDDSYLDSLPD